jgi:hypothetical protein
MYSELCICVWCVFHGVSNIFVRQWVLRRGIPVPRVELAEQNSAIFKAELCFQWRPCTGE